ncbi:c-type cytochrome [Amaricoccus solimangrovi]|uniref:Cytochrome c n=1 Tax=Amaricoccus solimangrovi TaxID=2589815 RepID=A0A501WRT7_9RHOB|nr:cytochrome c [Amaricoccus solimangrovi]TPE49711.1 cytochrome c [Amaricoccus solimangrovi]
MKRQFGAGIALGILGTVLAAVAIWIVVVYTGAYNVAASERHTDAVRWTLDTAMRRSVSSRAGGVEIPRDPPEDLLATGAGLYAGSCAHCHGAPGGEPEEWSRGMRPEPPRLAEAATEWMPEEIHWIVANGIRMSAMPAFGAHHTPEELVALTAFVDALPGLTPEDYAALTGTGGESAGAAPVPAGDAPARP